MFSVCTHHQHDTSKVLTTAIQSEIPIKQNILKLVYPYRKDNQGIS